LRSWRSGMLRREKTKMTSTRRHFFSDRNLSTVLRYTYILFIPLLLFLSSIFKFLFSSNSIFLSNLSCFLFYNV
jgi:hypothetical protein